MRTAEQERADVLALLAKEIQMAQAAVRMHETMENYNGSAVTGAIAVRMGDLYRMIERGDHESAKR